MTQKKLLTQSRKAAKLRSCEGRKIKKKLFLVLLSLNTSVPFLNFVPFVSLVVKNILGFRLFENHSKSLIDRLLLLPPVKSWQKKQELASKDPIHPFTHSPIFIPHKTQ